MKKKRTFIQFLYYGLYQFLWFIAPPFIRNYLKKRGEKAPLYLENWGERFCEAYPNPVKGCIWIHAVSVGEMRAAKPLVTELQKQFPDTPLLITQMTPTGRQTAFELFPEAQIRYLPYDKKKYVQSFLTEHQPIFGILMETEIWPNLITECNLKNIPLFLANARLSDKSLQGYLKAKNLILPVTNCITLTCAQTAEDAKRLTKIGVSHVKVCGNTKYDIEIPQQARLLAEEFKQKIGQRAVVVCASTRQGEEILLLKAWQQISTDALLIIVPRHPERFEEIYQLSAGLDFSVQKRSDTKIVSQETKIWIGDSMGELFSYYLCADIAFVGGTLVDVGGQNILEPLQCAKPTIFGFSTYNFEEICYNALTMNAAIQVQNAEDWAIETINLLANKEKQTTLMINAQEFTLSFKGASKKISHYIAEEIRPNKIF